MTRLILIPPILQMLVMLVDEGWFHRQRGLPRWERIGHPLDTLTTAACFSWMVLVRPGTTAALLGYLGLAAFSCLFVTKDEFIHLHVCSATESWLHSLLFVLHPLVFLAFGAIWWSGRDAWLVQTQLALTLAFGGYQLVYWSVLWTPKPIVYHR